MKKLLCVLALLMGVATVNAAMPAASLKLNAIGLRFGGGGIGGLAEISYQRAMGKANRLELDLGWNGGDNNSWGGLAGIYQWWWNISGGFNWFAGPGAQLGFYSNSSSGLALGIGGQIGIEYDFNTLGAPILLGLDVRPMIDFMHNSGFGGGGALSVRYTF